MRNSVTSIEGPDWPLAACVAVLVALFAADMIVLGLSLRPVVAAVAQLGEEEASSSTPPVAGPSAVWPALCAMAGLSVTAVAARRLILAREMGGPWLWVLVAAITGTVWSLMTVAVLSRIHAVSRAFLSH